VAKPCRGRLQWSDGWMPDVPGLRMPSLPGLRNSIWMSIFPRLEGVMKSEPPLMHSDSDFKIQNRPRRVSVRTET